jgi:uncharacterized protein
MLFCSKVGIAAVLLLATAAGAAPRLEISGFELADVRLLDSPFKEASERNARFLLSLDPDRLLHNTRKYAGLAPKGDLYGGWESQGIAGHTLGHYLTALSQQYAASGDERFRKRIDYMVAEMATAQRAYGDGYVGALPPLELATLRSLKDGKVAPKDAFFFEGGAWVPWYTQHKILAGLRDAWILGGNTQAREIALRLADWADAITAGLSESQMQTMLQVEHGGMVEVLMDLYARTGTQRYLAAAHRFQHHAILSPLSSGRDELPGRHANTQVPKIAGAARSYEVSGDVRQRAIAQEFWKRVVREHSWVIGGNSDGEFFFPPRRASEHLSAATAETCNTYNMLKLTEHLFTWDPQLEYADYYERALYNHILASQEPQQGMFAYYMALKPGHFRTYSTPHDSFWCCVGSGMENHGKYGRAIYFHGSNELYVNLFIPSVLTWKQKGLVLEQRTDYPNGGRIQLTILESSEKPLALRVRAPAWAAGALSIRLNAELVDVDGTPGRYVSIERTWKRGDRLLIEVPMAVRAEVLRGAPDQIALLYGPVVLAADLGRAPSSSTAPYAADQRANLKAAPVAVPTLAGNSQSIVAAVRRVSEGALVFRTEGIGKPADVTLRPFAELHYQRYNVYWKIKPLQ